MKGSNLSESTLQRGPGYEASPGKAALWALAIAGLLLVTVVMPAEYGIDWTGAGRVLGLTPMGEQKVAASKGAALPAVQSQPSGTGPSPPAQYAVASAGPLRADSVEVTLAPKGEIEYKAVLAEGDSIVYDWDAGGAMVTFDFHGEPADGPKGAFLSFQKGRAAKGAGTLKAPFAGTHGWYWQNPGPAAVVIKLKTSGFHSDLKKM